MDLSNLNPAVKKPDTTIESDNVIAHSESIENTTISNNTEIKDQLKGRVITDPEEIAAIEAKKKQMHLIVDAATRVAAQMRLEACENDVTMDAVYNERLVTLMADKTLDENGFKFAKLVLDGAFKVAKDLGVPNKEDAATILLLAKTATGEFNPREELEGARIITSKKSRSTLTLKERIVKKKKSKQSKQSRKTNRK